MQHIYYQLYMIYFYFLKRSSWPFGCCCFGSFGFWLFVVWRIFVFCVRCGHSWNGFWLRFLWLGLLFGIGRHFVDQRFLSWSFFYCLVGLCLCRSRQGGHLCLGLWCFGLFYLFVAWLTSFTINSLFIIWN